MDEQPSVVEKAKAVLEMNDQGLYTAPSKQLYPHQWLWDSCFTAIGLRHIDIARAKMEVVSLLDGQWHNGMVPNMIFLPGPQYARDRLIWNSRINSDSPDDLDTSGITQPPMIAEAVMRIGEKLGKAERRSWYKEVYPKLIAYHEWIYRDRDPHTEGLALLIHPWESGLDNTLPWMHEMHEHQLAFWIRITKRLHLGSLFALFRNDTKHIPAEQRMSNIDALGLFSTQRRLRRKKYIIEKMLRHSLFSIEDLTFNCILIRANQRLAEIAKYLDQEIPTELSESMKRTEAALEKLWDPYTGQYYSRDFTTHQLLKISTIGTLLPLYAGTLTAERAEQLVRLLENQHVFGANYPIPSVPLNAETFNPVCYWQGPTWINMNWLIHDGLERGGFHEHAEALRQSTLELIQRHGCYEYFDPMSGNPAGAPNFSWTAALALDLASR